MTAAASSPQPLLLLLLLLVSLSVANRLTSATVVLTPAALSFPDLPAKSALAVNSHGECGSLHAADPPHGCSPLRNGFQSDNGTSDVRFVLMMRGECAFEDKIRHAQNGGFRAAIVYDDKDKRNLVYMLVNPEGIKVHAVFVSKLAGEILKGNARGEKGECCIYPPSCSDAGWTVLAISFISLAVILCFLMIAFIAPRPFWMYLRQGVGVGGGGGSSLSFNFRKSVDARIVEALPQFVFCSARHRIRECLVGGETCAICLEDYQDGEVLKVLPCQHEFHSSCVVSWLTKWGTFCPVCKLDMLTNFAYSEVSEERPLLEFSFGVADVAGGMYQKGQLASESVNGLGGLPDFYNQRV